MTEYAFRNHTGDRPNEFWDFNKEAADLPDFPANFTLGGGYVRGTGHHLTPLGQTASPTAFGAVGSGTTAWMVDPVRGVTVVFLSSGLVEGLRHFQRLQRINDLALAAVI
jgi:CubicO group peptidase (beta-lactamase class C family)